MLLILPTTHAVDILACREKDTQLKNDCYSIQGVGTGEGDYMPKSVPDCVLSTLKMVNFQKFQGCNPEMRLLKFLLKNALVLEKINLFCSQSLSGDLENQKKIGNQLRGLSIGSKHCTLAFM